MVLALCVYVCVRECNVGIIIKLLSSCCFFILIVGMCRETGCAFSNPTSYADSMLILLRNKLERDLINGMFSVRLKLLIYIVGKNHQKWRQAVGKKVSCRYFFF